MTHLCLHFLDLKFGNNDLVSYETLLLYCTDWLTFAVSNCCKCVAMANNAGKQVEYNKILHNAFHYGYIIINVSLCS